MKCVVFLFLVIIGLINCVPPKNRDGCHQIFCVKNKTDQDIIYKFTSDKKVYYVPSYKSENSLVKAKGKSKDIMYYGGCFEDYFESEIDTCYLFLWYKDELKVIPQHIVDKYGMYSYKMKLTLDQLDSLDWTVTIEEGMLKSMLSLNPSGKTE